MDRAGEAGGALAEGQLEGQGDCARCAALCCMALAFDAGHGFGVDKPNAAPCPNLSGEDRCRIHEDREAAGFTGCVSYDCGGAGQYVSETLFGGRHWRDEPDLKAEMTAAFSMVLQLASLDGLLAEAGKLPLSEADQAALAAHRGALWPAEGWTPASLAALDMAEETRRVGRYLTGLRDYVRRAV